MRKIFILSSFILIILISIVGSNAVTGYNYSHKGEPIHSSLGLTTANDGIFTVVSDGWSRIDASKFTSPEDMYIYTEIDDEGIEKDIIYIVDSSSSLLYVFDENLNLKSGSNGIISKFEVRPENFTQEQYMKVKTRSDTSSVTLNSRVNWTKFYSAILTPEPVRTEAQRVYLELNGVSGVYRAKRPARAEDGTIIKGEYQDLLYLSDKGNNQIVIVDATDYHVVQVVSQPTDITFSGKTFAPMKLVTDSTGRIFVISEGVYEGIMQMSYYGKFMSYIGVNYAKLTAWETFWRRFSTDIQLSQKDSILNTEFKNMAIDSKNFIYTVSRATTDSNDIVDNSAMIKKINPSGNDTLTKNGYSNPVGDVVTINVGTNLLLRGPSRFTGVAVNSYGIYTVSDEKSGRLFSYDDEGNLLYISAESGPELGNLNNPVAIRYQGENILVLDKFSKAVIRFKPTDIAKVINRAVKYQYNGQLKEAAEEWKNVVSENPNYELAYVGIGKSLLNDGRYEDAMAFFQIGFNQTYYSRAYKSYRDQVIKENFPIVISMSAFAIVLLYGRGAFEKKRKKFMIKLAGDK
ncbi:MAG: hypothetical protein WC424_01935 [Bacilli bacterium]|jgi:hypothetical protein